MPAQTLTKALPRSVGRGSAAQDVLHLCGNVSELPRSQISEGFSLDKERSECFGLLRTYLLLGTSVYFIRSMRLTSLGGIMDVAYPMEKCELASGRRKLPCRRPKRTTRPWCAASWRS